MDKRIEHDTLGEVAVGADKYWGAQTQRAVENFTIGSRKMPLEIIEGLAFTKKAAAYANCDLQVLSTEKRDLIAAVCDEILAGKLSDHFPLAIWQTGSGTQTNMNVNEVIANRAEVLRGNRLTGNPTFISPNDDANKSQSTNDVFPTAIRIASSKLIISKLIPAIGQYIATLDKKIDEFKDIVKIGRTHLMDATPITLGQEFSAYKAQIINGLDAIKAALPHLMQLPIGGTAVGTGLNTPKGYDKLSVNYINRFTGLEFTNCPCKYEAMASHDAMVGMSGALKQLAVSLMKMANDIRLLASGPRCGIGEITIPANEPGSSIMPGKVNPTQCEALSMVCCQIIGNDVAITTGAMQGHLQLNVFMPLIGFNLLNSIHLLTDILNTFNYHCLSGIEPNLDNINYYLDHSLMLATALNTHIGYNNAAKIVQNAHKQGITLKESAIASGLVSEKDFDEWVNPQKMV
ncbi:MAG: class II fumarate hydratase [Bacteroidales bacterium]|nr:class II fumarate hydratase [Bacteroidales bacterium]